MAIILPLPVKPEGVEESQNNTGRIINRVTFFGDSAIPEDDPIYKSVFDASKLLAENGYVIVNGGGPGIMKAATDGAESVNGETSVVYWQPRLASIFEGRNLANVADETETSANYVVRTFGLIEKGDCYVVCKGGTGTISELGLVWALAKLYYGCHKPVILYGDFWDELIEAFQKTMNIDETELGVLYQATTPEGLLRIIQHHEIKIQACKDKSYEGDELAFILRPRTQMIAGEYNRVSNNYHSEHAGKLLAQDQLDEFISLVNPPAQVLDIGCGPGFDLKYLAERYIVKGIDISGKFVDIARFENPNSEIILADIVDYELPKNFYKGIWARDSIHHIPKEHLDNVFKKIADALVEGGIFYTIVREGEGDIIEKEKKSYSYVERFYHLFTAQELQDRAEKAGLTLVKIDHTKRSHKWLIGVFKK